MKVSISANRAYTKYVTIYQHQKHKQEESMTREQQAEYLKERLYEIIKSHMDEDKSQRIISCHIDSDLFQEMAYCFIAKHGK